VATFDLDFGEFAAGRLVFLVAVIKDGGTSRSGLSGSRCRRENT
jgi:hypothetical protein